MENGYNFKWMVWDLQSKMSGDLSPAIQDEAGYCLMNPWALQKYCQAREGLASKLSVNALSIPIDQWMAIDKFPSEDQKTKFKNVR